MSVSGINNNNIITVINPDDGKRYRLNIKGEIGRLTIGRLKECLASASSCPIPASEQVLKLNGTPLSNDMDPCAAYGITRGSTLTVESRINTDPSGPNVASFVSPQRRALEYQTIHQQEASLGKDMAASDDVLRGKMDAIRDQLRVAEQRRGDLERNKAHVEEELGKLREAAATAERERERLARLRQMETERTARRAADLSARREQLKAEEDAVRAVALQKLENERRRALLEQQRAEYEAERERLARERVAYEERAKERELSIRAKEIEMEQQGLAAERDRQELDLARLVSHQNRARYFSRVGLEPPAELLTTVGGPNAASHTRQVDWASPYSPGRPTGSRNGQWSHSNHPSHSGGYNNYSNNSHSMNNGMNQSGSSQGMANHGAAVPPLRSHPRTTGLLNSEEGTSPGRGYPNPSAVPSEPLQPSHGGVVFPHGGYPTETGEKGVGSPDAAGMYDAFENALANLRYLGHGLGLDTPLQFDANNTCVISVDGQYTLLVTFDATTERLFVYSTLLTSIPQDAEVRLRVYEFLMEGALLGREMGGGGVGASVKNDFLLMSTSIYLPTSHPTTLSAITPPFVQCLNKWRERLEGLMDEMETLKEAPAPQTQLEEAQPKREILPSQNRQRHPPMGREGTDNGDNQNRNKKANAHTNRLSYAISETTSARSRSGSVRAVVGVEATDSVVINGVATTYDEGVLVVNVTGPAAAAGMQLHDCIKKVDGREVRGLRQFQREVGRLAPGAVVPFTVDRNGLPFVIPIRVTAGS